MVRAWNSRPNSIEEINCDMFVIRATPHIKLGTRADQDLNNHRMSFFMVYAIW